MPGRPMPSNALCSHLRPLLLKELNRGNAIESSGAGGFGGRVRLLVILERPFSERWKTSRLVEYAHVHDPHYWEDEYNCLWHKDCLAAAWQTGRGCGKTL